MAVIYWSMKPDDASGIIWLHVSRDMTGGLTKLMSSEGVK